jgi:hypothetical protein
MANPTTNFGWQMPTSTDLVTDLPADFEVFGQAVDTALVDLKGGTTGQVLSKASNTDMDFTWVTDAAGDITGVTAGTGISGGGTSGTVTVTNSMATAIDAKGDLIGGTGADAFARLAVGANGTVLTADSAETTGMKWAAASGGTPTFVGCRITNSIDQSIANATRTIVTFDTETFDTDAFHSTSTNTGRMTIPAGKAGKYLVTAGITFAGNATGYREYYLFKNGSFYSQLFYAPNSTHSISGAIPDLVNLAVSDYLEIRVEQGSGGALAVRGDGWGVGSTYFGITYLGA